MSRKSKPITGPTLPHTIIHKLWTASGVDWLDIANSARPELRFIRKGPHIAGLCPYHDEKSGSFKITPSMGIAKCFGCPALVTNPVKVVAQLRKCSYFEALVYFKSIGGVRKLLPQKFIDSHEKYEKHQSAKSKLVEYCCDTLRYYLLDEKAATEAGWPHATVQYLKKRISVDNTYPMMTANQMFGILPPLVEFENTFGDRPELLEFAKTYLHKYLMDGHTWIGSIMLITHDDIDSVGRIKLRRPESKDFVVIGDDFEGETGGFRGYFGLQAYKEFLGAEDAGVADTVVLQEGEFDAAQTIAHQLDKNSHDFVALATGGGMTQGADFLATIGIKTVSVIPDRDTGGESFVEHLLQKTESPKLGFRIFVWPDEYANWRNPADPTSKIKDPDEAIRALGYERWAYHVNKADSYEQPHDWALAQAAKEINRGAIDDVRQKSNVATKWGRLLHNAQECKLYCAEAEADFGCDAAILFREIRASDEDEHAFVDRLSDVLREQFHFVGTRKTDNHKVLVVMWHIKNREMIDVVLGDERSAATALARFFGNVVTFVRNHVGDPAFLAEEGTASSIALAALEQRYKTYLNMAIQNLTEGLREISSLEVRAQGIHYIPPGLYDAKNADGAPTDEEFKAFMVNGKEVWKITFPKGELAIEALSGPRDGNFLFENSGAAWLTTVHTPDDILKADVDPKELFNTIHEMVSEGWTWRRHDVDSEFLATYTMCLAVMSIFPRQTAIMLTSEVSSGKSRFVSGFIGGNIYPDIHLVAAARGYSSYTAAALRSICNNSSLTVTLDEFEDYGTNDKKSLVIRAILESVRDMIGDSWVNMVFGTQGGSVVKYNVRFALVAAAIHPLRDEASLSRFITFELARMATRQDPQVILKAKWGNAKIAETKHKLAIGLIRHMPTLRALAREMEVEFGTSSALPDHVTARFKEGLYCVLAMQKFLGRDYKAFAYRFCESRKHQQSKTTGITEHEQVLDSLLGSNVDDHRDGHQGEERTIRQMLVDVDRLDAINQSNCGVFFDTKTNFLVVYWVTAVQRALRDSKFRREQAMYFQQIMQRSPHFVQRADVLRLGVMDRMAERIGPGITHDAVTVLDVGWLVKQAKELDAAKRTAQRASKPAGVVARPIVTPATEVEGNDGEGV